MVEKIKTNSVMNPLLWLLAIVFLTCVPAVLFSSGIIAYVLLALISLTLLVSVGAYFVWMFRDPDRLQSEEFRLEHQRILHATKEEGEIGVISHALDHETISFSPEEVDVPDQQIMLLRDGGV